MSPLSRWPWLDVYCEPCRIVTEHVHVESAGHIERWRCGVCRHVASVDTRPFPERRATAARSGR